MQRPGTKGAVEPVKKKKKKKKKNWEYFVISATSVTFSCHNIVEGIVSTFLPYPIENSYSDCYYHLLLLFPLSLSVLMSQGLQTDSHLHIFSIC
jgi:hypothetical protein